MVTTTGIKFKKFGEEFSNRISIEELNHALGYIGFGEEPLAFETLCDCICENGIFITKNEYEQICMFNTLFNCPLERDVVIYLKGLIIK